MKKLSLILAILIFLLSTGCGGTKNGSIAEDGISGKDFISNFVDKSGIKLHTLSETTKDNQDIGTFADAKENYNIKVDYHEDATTHNLSATSIVFKKNFDLDVFAAWATSVDNSFTEESVAQLYEDLVEKQKEESQKDGDHGVGTVKINGLKYMLNYFMEDAPRISVLKANKNDSSDVVFRDKLSDNDDASNVKISKFATTAKTFINSFTELTGIAMEELMSTFTDVTTKYVYTEEYPKYNFRLAYSEYLPTTTGDITGVELTFESEFNEFIFTSVVSLLDEKNDVMDASSLYSNLCLSLKESIDSGSNFTSIERNNILYFLSTSNNGYIVSIS